MRTIHNRLDRLEARAPDRLDSLTLEEIDAMIVRLTASHAHDEELPSVVAECFGWDQPRASAFIADCLAKS